jgi:GMP synthase-like glutamine amidotransferase
MCSLVFMKLTIIETGRPPEPIAAFFPRYPAMLEAMLRPHVGNLVCETIALIDGEPLPRQSDTEAVIITGSPVGVYDQVAWIAPLKAWILANADARIPQVGICFGHQIIADAFGGRVEKAPQGWGLGRHEYQVAQDRVWPGDLPSSFGIAVSHQDQVLEAPKSAKLLASSDFTPFAALLYEDAPALSLQGHPEFCPQFTDALIRSRRGTRFPEALADSALATLKSPLDRELVGGFIASFYRQHVGANLHNRRQAAA